MPLFPEREVVIYACGTFFSTAWSLEVMDLLSNAREQKSQNLDVYMGIFQNMLFSPRERRK